MHGKEFLVRLVRTYFILVTLITAATFVLGLYLDPGARFGYAAFSTPLIYAACGILPNAVMYSKRELTLKEFLVRKAVQFVLIEVIILSVAFYGINIHMEKDRAIMMGICILAIYVLVHIIYWIQNYFSARKITEELISFQKNINL